MLYHTLSPRLLGRPPQVRAFQARRIAKLEGDAKGWKAEERVLKELVESERARAEMFRGEVEKVRGLGVKN